MVKRNYVIASVVLSVLLSACGEHGAANSNKANTQVVAKVNGDEISIHQVNLQLGRAGQVDAEKSKQLSQQILTKLVDQQLLKQQALEAKLDRDPRVLQILEASKSEILAQAYIEQASAKAKKPTATDIDSFYTGHPELFEKRRVFRLQELVVEVPQDKHAAIESSIKDIANINEIATWLKGNQYAFNANSNVRAAEQLPANLLQQLQPLNDGAIVLVKTDKAINIVHLAASQAMPISKEKAKPIIEQYFVNLNKANLIKAEMDALKSKASIEYVGAFADMKNAQSSTAAAKNVTTPTISTSETNPAQSSQSPMTTSKPAAGSATTLDKGLAGM